MGAYRSGGPKRALGISGMKYNRALLFFFTGALIFVQA
jgi:hypothetical protein